MPKCWICNEEQPWVDDQHICQECGEHLPAHFVVDDETDKILIDIYDQLEILSRDIGEVINGEAITDGQRGDLKATRERIEAAQRSLKICIEDMGAKV